SCSRVSSGGSVSVISTRRVVARRDPPPRPSRAVQPVDPGRRLLAVLERDRAHLAAEKAQFGRSRAQPFDSVEDRESLGRVRQAVDFTRNAGRSLRCRACPREISEVEQLSLNSPSAEVLGAKPLQSDVLAVAAPKCAVNEDQISQGTCAGWF